MATMHLSHSHDPSTPAIFNTYLNFPKFVFYFILRMRMSCLLNYWKTDNRRQPMALLVCFFKEMFLPKPIKMGNAKGKTDQLWDCICWFSMAFSLWLVKIIFQKPELCFWKWSLPCLFKLSQNAAWAALLGFGKANATFPSITRVQRFLSSLWGDMPWSPLTSSHK